MTRSYQNKAAPPKCQADSYGCDASLQILGGSVSAEPVRVVYTPK